jgi:hypothetical protein
MKTRKSIRLILPFLMEAGVLLLAIFWVLSKGPVEDVSAYVLWGLWFIIGNGMSISVIRAFRFFGRFLRSSMMGLSLGNLLASSVPIYLVVGVAAMFTFYIYVYSRPACPSEV